MGAMSLRYSQPLQMRFGSRATLVSGLLLIVVAMALFARMPVDGSYLTDLLPVMVLMGAGAGTAFPALMTLAMSGATPQDAGLASGLVNTTVQVGGAVGLAVLATVSATRTAHLSASGQSLHSALTGGYQLAFVIATLVVGAAIAIALMVLKSDRPLVAAQSARRDAQAPELAYEPA